MLCMVLGLSPLARGNQELTLGEKTWEGPIPARAGQPPWACGPQAYPRAYPRSRGATPSRPDFMRASAGLSPLARGNQAHGVSKKSWDGPIPARAGQPAADAVPIGGDGAYPRSRGATVSTRSHEAAGRGLSPLARGNPAPRRRRLGIFGPIPARAGQPAGRPSV